MKIGVVGFGMGGATVAWRLAAAGHDVIAFEQAPECGSVGAGILLQPSGQTILRRFGILEAVRQVSATITGLDARHRSGRRLTTLDYATLDHRLHGLGVMRSALFDILHERCLDVGVDIQTGRRIVDYRHGENEVFPLDEHGSSCGSFDVLVVADGSNSSLRVGSGIETTTHEYDVGAMWMAAPYDGDPARLVQIVDRSGRLVGMLPIGGGRCSFFWGIRLDEIDDIRHGGLEQWQATVAEFLPDAGAIAARIESLDDVAFAGYRTVRMATPVDERVVFIGDAAHATSPHLGQGTNMALVDAAVLAEALGVADRRMPADLDSISRALVSYGSDRRATHRFYGQLTGFLTPFFQTSNPTLRAARDLALPIMPRVPILRSHMVLTMSGLKTSWVRPMRTGPAASDAGLAHSFDGRLD